MAYIISDRPQEIIRSISTELDRGVTILRGAGAWSGEAKDVLMCAFKQKQIVALKQTVKSIDQRLPDRVRGPRDPGRRLPGV